MLGIYGEVYDNVPASQAHTLEIVTRLVGEDGRSLFTSRETHKGNAGAASTTVPVSKEIPLDDVPPGTYMLQVEVTPRGIKDAKPIARETVVTVAPAAITR